MKRIRRKTLNKSYSSRLKIKQLNDLGKRLNITSNEIQQFSDAAAKKAVNQYKKDMKKSKREVKDFKEKNIKLLMVNYRMLKAHCICMNNDQQAEELSDELVNMIDILSKKIQINSINMNHAKTQRIMMFVDAALIAYSEISVQGNAEETRRCKVLKSRYINSNKLSVSKCADVYHVSEKTIHEDTRKAFSDLSTIIFGIEAPKFM